jgi:hypothetical protein
MRPVKLCLAASILMASSIGAAAGEMVRPFEALEQSRRDRIELDKRQKREEAEQRKRERRRPGKRPNASARRQRQRQPRVLVPRQPTYLLSPRQIRRGLPRRLLSPRQIHRHCPDRQTRGGLSAPTIVISSTGGHARSASFTPEPGSQKLTSRHKLGGS